MPARPAGRPPRRSDRRTARLRVWVGEGATSGASVLLPLVCLPPFSALELPEASLPESRERRLGSLGLKRLVNLASPTPKSPAGPANSFAASAAFDYSDASREPPMFRGSTAFMGRGGLGAGSSGPMGFFLWGSTPQLRLSPCRCRLTGNGGTRGYCSAAAGAGPPCASVESVADLAKDKPGGRTSLHEPGWPCVRMVSTTAI